MTPALEVHRLSVTAISHASKAPIVHSISLVLAAGERLTILGESGSGKSVVVQAIMGNLPTNLQASGDIAIGGQTVLGRHALAGAQTKLWGHHIAMLPQEPWLALNPSMRSHPQVSEVPYFVKAQGWLEANRIADRALTQLQIQPFASRKYAHQISGGMAQRVALAATCAAGAKLLIADEPTKGLDAHLRVQVAQILTQSATGNHALITITHDVALARWLGGTIAIMLEGVIIEQGPASQVLEHPQHPYSQALVAADPTRWLDLVKPLASNAGSVVEACNLSKTFGTERLFSDVSLTVAEGEVLAITGPSGCGKTSLGHLLLGLDRPDTGTVRWLGTQRPHARQKLYQDPPAAFAPKRTLRQCLNDLITLHHKSSADAQALMQSLKLSSELLDRLPEQVSGGELQRFALLRVLLLQPAFVFADEPTSRLDPITQKITMALLCNSASEHRFGVVLVTHDDALAEHAAHRSSAIDFHLAASPPYCRRA